ncbi:MAG: bifunctional glutamate N-acetyltransferase/amino-acid acetyltransferase ArgJ [Syntrophobacterales bacterium]|nr:bifunctional glutamate N-acetyltransferase/amino-acid acetyltransferase ArgJ [Syntrophobacterales bacterium]
MTRVHAEVAKNTKDVVVVRGRNFVIPGILVSVVESGMRYKGRPDLAIIVSEKPDGIPAAGVFTQNLFTAAPVILSREHLKKSGHHIRAILINAGIANACTGKEGLYRARISAELVAKALKVAPESILIASTGVIGPHIDIDTIANSLDELIAGLSPNRWDEVARAIMTTDTVPKLSYVEVETQNSTIRIGGVAKGSGMIAPNMATMLGFICTDLNVDPITLETFLRNAVSKSFNAITVDGDTSTNDTVLLLASGNNKKLETLDTHTSRLFLEALEALSKDLAKQIVLDGEGATKFIEIEVVDAPSEEVAKRVAKTVAESPLVKTAFYGEDANWGRIIAAVGRSGVSFDVSLVSLFFDEVCVFRDGMPVQEKEIEERASAEFKKKQINVRISLGMGNYSFRIWTCDFSHDYVTINAKYRT